MLWCLLASAEGLPSLSASCFWCPTFMAHPLAAGSKEMCLCCRWVAGRWLVAAADHCSSGAATAVPFPEHTAAAAGLPGRCPAAQSGRAQEGGQLAAASSWPAAACWARAGSPCAAVPAGQQPAVVAPVGLPQPPCTGALTWSCPQTCSIHVCATHVLHFVCTTECIAVLQAHRAFCLQRSCIREPPINGEVHAVMIHCMPVDAADYTRGPFRLRRAGTARQPMRRPV